MAIAGVLRKDKVPLWIESLGKEFEVIAPVTSYGETVFTTLSNGTKPALDFDNSLASLKGFFLPHTETLFTFTVKGANFDIKPVTHEEKKRVIFGMRPCDLSALLILDKVFDGELRDVYYLSRREQTSIVCLTCITPAARCFCGSVGSGPSISANFDVLLTELSGYYLVEVGSAKGKYLVDKVSALLRPSNAQRERKKRRVVAEAEKQVKKAVDPLEVARRMEDRFGDAMWGALAQRCIECGGCVYVCPTCWCFNVYDVVVDGEGRRTRCWDACLFSGFTRMAGGLNPRGGKEARLKQRFYHKWDYFVDRYSLLQCVGCGRCTETAPCGIDWEQVFDQVMGER